jgi:pimeloyl-ACP methyl ester carboxylesterase
MFAERMFDAGPVVLNYAEGPAAGPPLVLLHGGGDRWQDFLPLLPALAARWHVYAPDLRGHGKSGRVPQQYRPEHYAADVIALLAQRIGEPAVLFGHSLGGWVALLVTVERPGSVRALILGDPPLSIERFLAVEGSAEKVRFWRDLRALASTGLPVAGLAAALADFTVAVPGQEARVRYGDLPGVDAVGLRRWAKSLSQVDPDVAAYHAEGRLDEYVACLDLEAHLRQVACPTLLVQADPESGGMVSDADVARALALLGDGVHARLEGVGHGLGLDHWEVAPLLRAVSGFLEAL